jgi:hypothetical protein
MYSWKKFEKHKALEIELHQWDSVDSIAYLVDPEKNYRNGQFVVTLSKTDGVVAVETPWVLSNFEKDVVQAVMNDAIGAFHDVKEQEVPILIDNRQVQKLRYVVPQQQGEEPYFLGILSNDIVVKLDNDYVSQFPKGYVDHVISQGIERSTNEYFHVPPGAPRTQMGHWMLDDKYPLTKYLQEGASTCLFCSFASALHYVKFEETAGVIASLANSFSADSNQGVFCWRKLLEIMKERLPWLQPQKINGKVFDIFTDVSPYPTVMTLESNDGGIQHAITVVGKIVFDSNCARALPLTQTTLDYCCSTDTRLSSYKRVYKGYRFMENPFAKKKKFDQLQRNGLDFFMDEMHDKC